MPGIPLDAMSQVKHGLKRLFQKRQKGDHGESTATETATHAPTSTSAPAAPERYEDEVEYAPEKPATLSNNAAAVESQQQPPTEPVTSSAPQASVAQEGSALTAGDSKSASASEPIEQQSAVPTGETPATGAGTAADAKQGPAATTIDGQTGEAETDPAKNALEHAPVRTPREEEKEGSPAPAMSATSGPLEDNPALP